MACIVNSGFPLVLASQSPRRIELMRKAGYVVEVLPVDAEEAHDASLTPEELTMENARRKAAAAAVLRPAAVVIGADTLVYVDGEPMGKPRDMQDAVSMLRRLSGRTHRVCTGVALARSGGTCVQTFAVISEVTFKRLSDESINTYYQCVDPLDKAGGYAIQERSDLIIDHTTGSWSNIVGLPMERLKEELNAALSRR